MDMNVLKLQILHGSLVKRLIVKGFLFVTVMIVVSFVQMGHLIRNSEPMVLNFGVCPLNFGSNPNMNVTGFFKPVSGLAFPLFGAALVKCEDENLSKNVFKELMEKNFLDLNAKALCVGKKSLAAALALRELGVWNAIGVDRHPYFSLLWRRFVYELDYEDNSFDFVFSRDLDRVSVPALLVLEIERVLRPGGTGAMLVGSSSFYAGNLIKGNLIRSATPVSSFLKSSDVVHVCGVGSFTLVMFKKRSEIVESLERAVLPANCPSTTNNKPFLKYLEPLVEKRSGQFETEISYLPKFMNISSRNKLVYINIGAGEFVESSIAKIFKPHYPIPHHFLNVFVIDHNTSALPLYVKNPGINFVYHPGLGGEDASPFLDSDEYLSAPLDHEGFDFIPWFSETVEEGDYVVLMMNARTAELNILAELFRTRSICNVDELFLRCSAADCKNALCGDCISLFKTLRGSGVFAHQWWGD
ncbi:PREDICTED: uncharacterized protein LOC109207515 [Nicotiana attenuata]|uniref:Uncharacterized protein n=1 Tax=Nicotiana attenuata TaxID=49451 RepID=A0A314KT79_NICAT|nr:PREDICTED: uncharacterized protein LOC109207515 [Nicotiana attenuata]OIT32307.1 hypothetical protein A4A49_09555 [Nicotiana attenuata]